MAHDYDLFVLGAGSGGVRASRMAAGYGARVAVAEERDLGGTCVNVGCIPKKLLVYASHVSAEIADAAGYGWTVEPPRFDWPTLIANKDREISRLNGVYERMLDRAGVEIIAGRARIVDPHTVEVAGRRYGAEHILVATGGLAELPAIPGIEHALSSNECFHLKALPPRVLVVGGGYIAVEFAGIFHGLGSQVTQLYRRELFLRGFDGEVRAHLAQEMRHQGIDLRFGLNVTALARTDAGVVATLTDGSQHEADAVLFATGRRPLTADLGLEEAGVELGPRGEIRVDAHSQSSVPSIHAIGDATDRINLTPVALAEGMALARTLFGGVPTAPDHSDVPSAVFSQPPLASVGLTEEEARGRYADVDVYCSSFTPLKHTLTGHADQALVKLLVDGATDRVLGIHVVAADAAEIVQGFAVAVKSGATKSQLDATIGIHPTLAEELVTLREKVR